ncbi:MAG: EFR1 family ferrodoxin [Clostridia bacterium]|nr:EFR1 family ferrodoxin [Clostridia bacterium]
MKTIIYYFTGTGNSLRVAKSLAQDFESCSIVPIAEALTEKQSDIECEAVGFIFPVYFYGLPEIVVRFIKQLEFKNNPYCFAVAVSGHEAVGGAIPQMQKLLTSKEQRLMAGFYVNMVFNFILWPVWDVPKESKHKHIYDKAEAKIRKIAKIVGIRQNKIERGAYDIPGTYIISSSINKYWDTYMRKKDSKFNVKDSCNSCGICERICPVNNICIEEGRPRWMNNNCQQCIACLHCCPTKAIQYGSITVNKRRFFNPDIALEEIMYKK